MALHLHGKAGKDNINERGTEEAHGYSEGDGKHLDRTIQGVFHKSDHHGRKPEVISFKVCPKPCGNTVNLWKEDHLVR